MYLTTQYLHHPASQELPAAAAAPAGGGGSSEEATQRKRAELESLVGYLESELTGRLHTHIRKQAEVKGLEAERDFYLHKLLAIEQLAHTQAAVSVTAKRTLQILSARA